MWSAPVIAVVAVPVVLLVALAFYMAPVFGWRKDEG